MSTTFESAIHMLDGEHPPVTACGKDARVGTNVLTSKRRDSITCPSCRGVIDSDFVRRADVQALITLAEDTYARLEIQINHIRDNHDADENETGSVYDLRDTGGNYVLAPLLQAQALSLHTLAILKGQM